MTAPDEPTTEDRSRDTELATSLRPASVDPGADFGDDATADPAGPPEHAGYDVDAVSGDTDAVRPQ